MKTITVRPEGLWLPKALADLGAAVSVSEARRLVAQGAVKLDGVKVADVDARLMPTEGVTVQVGRRLVLDVVVRKVSFHDDSRNPSSCQAFEENAREMGRTNTRCPCEEP